MFYPPVYNQAMSVDGYQWPNEVQYQPQVVPEAAYDPQAYSYNAPYEVTVAHNQESLPVMQSSFEKRVEGRLGSILKLLYTAKNHQTVKLEEVVGRLEAKIDQALNHFEQAVGNIEQRMEEFNTSKFNNHTESKLGTFYRTGHFPRSNDSSQRKNFFGKSTAVRSSSYPAR